MLQTISDPSNTDTDPGSSRRHGAGFEDGVYAADARTDDLEIAVLQVAIAIRGLPPRAVWRSLGETERTTRLEALLTLWRAGCRSVMDEGLAGDIAFRRPNAVSALRRCSVPPLGHQPSRDAV